jgi:DNA-3-methyladenine glycosylase II
MSDPNPLIPGHNWLISNCELLGPVAKEIGPVNFQLKSGTFEVLVNAIVSQQLSVKAASTIHGRLIELLNHNVSPGLLAQLSAEQLQQCGISRQKQSYLYDLSRQFIQSPKDYDKLYELTDDKVITRLVRIKGIGVWTSQMYLIFSLGRPDVFPVDDLGVKLGMQQLFGWDKIPSNSKILETAERWKPWRSAASWYLWRLLEKNRRAIK